MKKILKSILLIPIFIITVLLGFACGSSKLESISLSLPNYYIVDGYYNLKLTNINIPVSVSINPDSYAVSKLTWESSATDVVTVYCDLNRNEVTIKTRNTGKATITASYKNEDGSTVKTSIKVRVEASSQEMSFSQEQYNTNYIGEDLKDNYKILQDVCSDRYSYKYYSVTLPKDNSTYVVTPVENIIDAGTYQIICIENNNQNKQCSTMLYVDKAVLNLSGNNYEITYGQDLPEDLYSLTNLPTDLLTNGDIGEFIYGIGKDSESKIGKFVETTCATYGSNAGSYRTGIYFDLYDDEDNNFKNNYSLNAVVTEGVLKVLKKQVVLSVKNQTVVYGSNVEPNKFDLYSYEEYVDADFDLSLIQPISNKDIDFAANILLGEPSYKLNGQAVTGNASGVLDVLTVDGGTFNSYDLCYDNYTTTTVNLDILVKIDAKLTVTPKDVVVLPKDNQSKIYGEADPESLTYNVVSGYFVNRDNILNFLKVDYNVAGELGTGNYLANVNEYYYKIDNTLNKNYKISLSNLAVEDEGANADNTNKIRFKVLPCEVVIKLKDKTDKYKVPAKLIEGEESIHSVSYYSKLPDNSASDYTAEIESITVNNEEISDKKEGIVGANNLSADFNESGIILFKTGGTLKFSVKLEKINNENYFVSYKTNLDSTYFENTDGELNYKITYLSSTLNLNKISIIVKPKMTEKLTSKEFDGLVNDDGLIAGFSTDYEIYDPVTGKKYVYTDNDGNQFEDQDLMSLIVANEDTILTLTNQGNLNGYPYTRISLNGKEEQVEQFKDVGKYQIFLSQNLTYNKEYEHFDIKLDDSQKYYFTISKYTVLITPINDENSTKVYGSVDPEKITFTYDSIPEQEIKLMDSGELTKDTKLSRASGENVGSYLITLGSLSFGDNYYLVLSSNPVYFNITPRTVNVEPISYATTYGESYPEVLGYTYEVEEGFEDFLITAPVFDGKLSLDGQKIGDYYPVKLDADGNVLSYNILQGSLTCNNNYSINFVEGSTYKVNKRTVNIDITSQQIQDKDDVTTTGLLLNNKYYIVSNILDGCTTDLVLNLKENDSYFDVNATDVNLTVRYEGEDVSYCYDFVLGKSIVYNIDVTVIYLAIVDSATHLNSFVSSTYSGTAKSSVENPLFTLMCQTNGYSINHAESSYNFSFDSGEEYPITSEPIDVASYVASILLENDGKIVIQKDNHECDSECQDDCQGKITFNALDNSIVKNCLLSISNYGYLDITRANINYVSDKLGFEEDLFYSTEVLSKLKTSYTDDSGASKPIFVGANGEAINLRVHNDTGLNYQYYQTNYSLSTLEANRSYYINVTIQAMKDEDNVNKNYNTLTLNVPLRVVPKNLMLDLGKSRFSDTEGITYDGSSKNLTYSLEFEKDENAEVVVTYSYYKLKAFYNSSTKGYFEYYNFNPSTQLPDTGSGIKKQLFEGSQLDTASISMLELINFNSVNYILVTLGGNVTPEYCLLLDSNQNSSPVNAGIYICAAFCETSTNYAFAYKVDGDEKTYVLGSMFAECKTYEVEKSENIIIDNWKEEFKYTTQFNLTDPDEIPFEYNITPNFKSQIKYEMDDSIEWPANNMLNVGDYSVLLTFENENYYFKKDILFKVTNLDAEIIFPTIKTYVFTGQPITSFLDNIKILEKDKDGNTINSFYYTYNNSFESDSHFVFEFYKDSTNNTKLDYIPSEVTQEDEYYILKVIYGRKDGSFNYYGEGEFQYRIIAKPYNGSVNIQNTTITYNPLYINTKEDFCNLIYNRMFSIGLSSGYGVHFSFTNRNNETKTIFVFDTTLSCDFMDEESWKDLLAAGEDKKINIRVVFDDITIGEYKQDALLTIEKQTVSASEFTIGSESFIYSGYNIYNPLTFKELVLSPDKISEDGKSPTYFNSNYYYAVKTSDKIITVKDVIGNAVFTLTYSYQEYNAETETFNDIDYVPYKPAEYRYKVIYGIELGNNYVGNLDSIKKGKEYKINKVSTLYINATDWGYAYDNIDVLTHWNNYMKDYVENNSNGNPIESLYRVSNKSLGETNMNVFVSVNQMPTYNPANGVYIYVYFTNDKGDKIDTRNPANAGNYTMHITLLKDDNYNLSEYFTNVKFGSSAVISIEELENSESDGYYTIGATSKLEVRKKSYSFNNYVEALTINNIGSVDTTNNTIILTSNSTISIRGAGIAEIKIQSMSSGNYSDITSSNTSIDLSEINLNVGTTYYIKIVCDDSGNYSSNLIKIKITS